MGRRWTKLAVAVPLAAVVAATAGTWVYLNVIRDDAPDRLTLGGATDGDGPSGATTTTTGATAGPPGTASSATGVEGTWTVAPGSVAGYRVQEVLFGQRAEAVGRTEDVTGRFVIDGAAVTSGSFTVDMTTVRSDESRRDGQFRGRIMDVATYPTSTFTLTRPIPRPDVPGDGRAVPVEVTGDLTLRGTTRPVTFTVSAQQDGSTLKVAGTIPIVFADWGIPNPSGGPARTEDDGELEFLLVLGR